MTSAVMEPELEEAVDAPDIENENDDDDRPGWLISYVDGKQPIVVRLEGTPDEDLSEEGVFERFDQAEKKGATFFKLGRYRGRIALIRDLAWSEDVEMPELVAFDSLQDRLENLADAQEEIQQGVVRAVQAAAQAAQNTVMLQQAQAGLQQAQAQLFESFDVEDEMSDDDDQAPKGKSGPAAMRPLKLGQGSGKKLPPGVVPPKP